MHFVDASIERPLGEPSVLREETIQEDFSLQSGGGLVQHLRKSYSLSDLTGEKEDENRNTPDAHDETDMEVEPRRREHVGRRGYSPRRTQSSSNRVEMYFSEVDVDVRQPRPREPVVSLTNIRSSEDISSGYSSGEALQTHRATPQGDSLVRTSSVGARTRGKPRSSTKKTPEDDGEDPNCVDLPSLTNTIFPLPFGLVTPERAVELLLLLSRDGNRCDFESKFGRESTLVDDLNVDDVGRSVSRAGRDETKPFEASADGPRDTDPTLSAASLRAQAPGPTEGSPGGSADLGGPAEGQERKGELSLANDAERAASSEGARPLREDSAAPMHSARGADELDGEKLEELKRLLADARNALTNIVSSRETFEKEGGSDSESSSGRSMKSACTDISRGNSESTSRAGRYNKKPAPKAPASESQDTLDESGSENALKATLVIKTGSLKTIAHRDATKNVFLARATDATKLKGKKSRRQRTKEGFSKLLTIPKNIFHNPFHKDRNEGEKEQDGLSESASFRSRSDSTGSRERCAEIAAKALERGARKDLAEHVGGRRERGTREEADREAESLESLGAGLDSRDRTEVERCGKDTERVGSLGVVLQEEKTPPLRKDSTEIVTDIY
ncbi:hypothetical protein KM043_006098 [Ampulex compressa]|nr:hypothetical protein KM043_006098 [Ampulex compressa]